MIMYSIFYYLNLKINFKVKKLENSVMNLERVVLEISILLNNFKSFQNLPTNIKLKQSISVSLKELFNSNKMSANSTQLF